MLAQPEQNETERVVQLRPATTYPHPWLDGFLLTYTTDFSGGQDSTGNYPQVLEITTARGPQGFSRFYLRNFPQKTWEKLEDSRRITMPLEIYVDDFAGVWCKWIRPAGPPLGPT
jgi:hypothetical protein